MIVKQFYSSVIIFKSKNKQLISKIMKILHLKFSTWNTYQKIFFKNIIVKIMFKLSKNNYIEMILKIYSNDYYTKENSL